MFNSKFILLIALFLIQISSRTVEYTTDMGRRTGPIPQKSPKVYEINLDLSYKERWRQIAADFEKPLEAFIDGLGINLDSILNILDSFDYFLVEAYNKEFALEMKAISELMSLSFTEVAALNFIYEATAQCTSIIAQDPTGNIIHARNVDFYYADLLGSITFHGKYYRKGKLVYEAITLAGYAGVITGYKPGAYSFSLNQYTMNDIPKPMDYLTVGASDLLQMIQRKMSPPYIVRAGFETIPDYEGFVKYLKETDTVSNVFYTVSGTKSGEGTIITKSRQGVQDVKNLDVDSGIWYIAITNYNTAYSDPERDNRLTAAREWMNKIGQNGITKDNILENIMKVYPVFNNFTFHTTVMQAKTNYFDTILWW